MKLYSVSEYQEYYYKALREPIYFDPFDVWGVPVEEDPVAACRDIVDLEAYVASMGPTAWPDWVVRGAEYFIALKASLPEAVQQTENFIKDIRINVLHYIPAHLQDQWRTVLTKWYASEHKSWELVYWARTTLHPIWLACEAKVKEFTAASDFYKAIRASETWKMIYDKLMATAPAGPAAKGFAELARNYADGAVKKLLSEQMRFQQMKAITNEDAVTRLINGFIEWLGGATLATVASTALIGAAAIIGLVLLVNPEEWGVRSKFYRGSKYLMSYGEQTWWADMVGFSHYWGPIYTMCGETGALIKEKDEIEVRDRPPLDCLWLTTPGGPWEKIGWYYWMTMPRAIVADYIGMLKPIGGYFYVNPLWGSRKIYLWRDKVWRSEIPPYRPLDVITIGKKEIPVEAAKIEWLKPGSEWCVEPDVDWVYIKWEPFWG